MRSVITISMAVASLIFTGTALGTRGDSVATRQFVQFADGSDRKRPDRYDDNSDSKRPDLYYADNSDSKRPDRYADNSDSKRPDRYADNSDSKRATQV